MNTMLDANPVAEDALKFLQSLGKSWKADYREAFAQSAADGDEAAAYCVRLMDNALLSEYEALALAWTIRDMEDTSTAIARSPDDNDYGEPSFLELAVRELLDTEDATGCPDELTVVAKEPVEKLRRLLEGED